MFGMSEKWQLDIYKFHKEMGCTIQNSPSIPDEKTIDLRLSLIKEEVGELLEAIQDYDLVKIADGGADAIVVILGTMVSYGINLQPVWDEVHKTNMAKVGGEVRSDGKRLKPPGWTPPDIKSILTHQVCERCQDITCITPQDRKLCLEDRGIG